MSIDASTTFTVLEAGTMPEIFQGRLGPDEGGCFLYGRHFNPTVFVLGRQLAALEGAESALALGQAQQQYGVDADGDPRWRESALTRKWGAS